MKKKIFLFLAMLGVLMCLSSLSVGAAEMTSYCTVKLTLTTGETVTAYCQVAGNQMKRDELYKSADTSGGTYNWEDVVVFDCRDQLVVGSGKPQAFSGIACNSKAMNVTTVYLSDYFTYFLNTTFTSGWKMLDTVYIPSTVTEIKGFGSSPVKRVVIEEGSQLKSIGGDAFKDCSMLNSINLEGCAYLKNIDSNAFRGCSSLDSIILPEGLESIGYNGFYLSGLSGTIIVPNSVTTLGAGAFLNTKIETLVLGDGAVSIDYNFLCDLNSAKNNYLKNVYISDETVFLATNIFYKSQHPVNFYIVGENCDAVKEALLSQSAPLNYSLMTFVLAEDATEEMGAGYGIIHTGYNRCDAFYNEIHQFGESDLTTCLDTCTRCGETKYNGGAHTYVITEDFDGEKYVSVGVIKNICTVCSVVEKETSVGIMFTWLGYSVSEYAVDGKFAMAQWFTINQASCDTYMNATGKSLEYGIVASLGAVAQPLFLSDGKVEKENGVISAPVSGFNVVEIKIAGIKDEKKDISFVFSGYISDGIEIMYINNGAATKSPLAVSYNDIVNITAE